MADSREFKIIKQTCLKLHKLIDQQPAIGAGEKIKLQETLEKIFTLAEILEDKLNKVHDALR
jgi:hypothetical protein